MLMHEKVIHIQVRRLGAQGNLHVSEQFESCSEASWLGPLYLILLRVVAR